MTIVLLAIFFILSCLMIKWGLTKPDRYYTYPTLAGFTWLLYIFPMAVGAVVNPNKYPRGVIEDFGVESALLMCILCIVFGWMGYCTGIKKFGSIAYCRYIYTSISYKRVAGIALVIYLVSFLGAYKLAGLAGGFTSQFTGGGHYGLEWRGAPVMYSFISGYMAPAFFMLLLCAFYFNKKKYWLFVLLSSIYPLATIVFLGRRSKFAEFCAFGALAFFFTYKKTPPRLIVLCGAILVGLVIIIGDAYRTISQHGLSHANIQEIKRIDVNDRINSTFMGRNYSEFDVIVVECARFKQELSTNYGTSLWNAFMRTVIPRQFVGQSLKDSLMITKSLSGRSSFELYGWEVPYGSNPTGPGSAFIEFSFLGCLFYSLIGYAFSWLWAGAYYKNDLRFQIWYGVFVMLIPGTIAGTINLIPGYLFWNFIVLYPLLYKLVRPAQKKVCFKHYHA